MTFHRDDSQLLDPPPPGSTWTWQPDVITADGANAGPNAIRAVCLESDPAYDPLRVHCHVHLKRDVQQNKHDLFKNSCTDTASVKDCASATTTMIEQVKSNSISPELAQLGKEMIVASLQSDSHDEAADYIAKFVDKIKKTSFHILEPIKNEAYVRSLLGRLRYSGLPLNEVKCRALLPHSPSGNDGKDEMEEEEAPATDQYFLYKCSCGRYRHYAWCLHVMCRAVYDDLVWKPYRPKTMDSAKVLSVRKCGGAPAESGRHAKARKGGALDKRQ